MVARHAVPLEPRSERAAQAPGVQLGASERGWKAGALEGAAKSGPGVRRSPWCAVAVREDRIIVRRIATHVRAPAVGFPRVEGGEGAGVQRYVSFVCSRFRRFQGPPTLGAYERQRFPDAHDRDPVLSRERGEAQSADLALA